MPRWCMRSLWQGKTRFGLQPTTRVVFFKRLCIDNRARWKESFFTKNASHDPNLVPYVFCIFKMYNTGWAKSRRALDCFFIFMAEILVGYWQILDRSGKKIILLSPLPGRQFFVEPPSTCYAQNLLFVSFVTRACGNIAHGPLAFDVNREITDTLSQLL